MNARRIALSLAIAIATFAAPIADPVAAHEVPNIKHTHAFQQTGYGTYRQGHYVNGPNGSIVIWSARPYTGYQRPPAVKFARPEPITRAPAAPKTESRIKINKSSVFD